MIEHAVRFPCFGGACSVHAGGEGAAAAVAGARASGQAGRAATDQAAREARAAFDRTAHVLGTMHTPTPETHGWIETALDAAAGEAIEISHHRADTHEKVLQGLTRARFGGR